jgi:pyruvate-formate lyase-activating enzyme
VTSSIPGLVADVVRLSWVDGPGNRFVVFLQGCTFDCVGCHNPQTIPEHSVLARTMWPEELLEEIRSAAPYLSGITMSGGEATRQAGFVGDVFARIKADAHLASLTTFVDTNGDAPREVWDALVPVMDGAMVDLKALDPRLHVQLTGHGNIRVLDSIRHLAEVGRLYEVRLLLVPGVNDDHAMLERTAAWLLAVDPAIRVKVIGFRRHGVRHQGRQWREATDDDVDGYGFVLRDAGISRLELV